MFEKQNSIFKAYFDPIHLGISYIVPTYMIDLCFGEIRVLIVILIIPECYEDFYIPTCPVHLCQHRSPGRNL